MTGELSPVGTTAVAVAAARAAEHARDDRLFADSLAWSLVSAATEHLHEDVASFAEPMGKQTAGAETASMQQYFAVRTRFLDECCLIAAREYGCRQVVILAAGLDTRAFRLPWPDHTELFELDRPELFAVKEETLSSHVPTAERRVVAVDLREDWPSALRQAGFRSEYASLWVVEGLMLYLDEPDTRLLLERLNGLAAVGSRIAATHTEPEALERRFSQRFRAQLKLPEQLWAANPMRAPATWLGERGWDISAPTYADCAPAYGRTVNDDDYPGGRYLLHGPRTRSL